MANLPPHFPCLCYADGYKREFIYGIHSSIISSLTGYSGTYIVLAWDCPEELLCKAKLDGLLVIPPVWSSEWLFVTVVHGSS